ncbi:MAG: ABC transporter permease [Prevotella sp.]|jgi:putative ABC transport system permease protein|nr:ABC transporter permease [Prevotella sp.]
MNIFRNMLYMARRFKTATVLNFIGLTVALTAFYLLMTQVVYNISYNSCIPDNERVFRFETKMGSDSPWGINCNRPTNAILSEMPQVEAMTELASWGQKREFVVGESVVEHPRSGSNLTPFGAISAHCLDGKLSWDDYGERSVIIPASLAKKIFGRTDVAGQPIYSKSDTLTVQGVYEDFPANCSMKNDVYYATQNNLQDWSEWSYIVYVKLREGVDAESMLKGFGKQFKEQLWKLQWGGALAAGEVSESQESEVRAMFDRQFDNQGYRLTPIRDTYFSGVHGDDKGNPAILFILELSCVLVIVIAAINFLNFVLAESPMRIKSVNTRRVLGEGVARLRLGMIAETVLTALIAYGLALVVCELVAKQPTELLLGSLALGDHTVLLAITALLAVAVGIVAGVYPAFFATSFQPALVLKGSFGLTPKGRKLRSTLVALQLGIALLMVTYISILLMQSRYIYNSDYGFDKDEVLYAPLTNELRGKKDAVRAELMQQSGVSDVSFSRFVLGAQDGYMGWGRADNDHQITFTSMPVDWHYLRTMGIKVIEGRDFTEHDGDCYIINEAARKQWPWVEIDKKLLDKDYPVIGVCEDIRYASTRKDRHQEPLAFIIFGESFSEWGDQLGIANIRVTAGNDKVATRKQISDVLTRMGSGEQVETKFLDQKLEDLYQDEFRFIRQVGWFSGVCLVITLIGVFCMTMFETEYRRKEIGIRKVMGSSTQEILMMFCRHYALLLAVSFIIAAPIAYYIGRQWLQSFAERTPIYWWLFPLALLTVGVITLTTVIIQSWRTANENPINSIKNE